MPKGHCTNAETTTLLPINHMLVPSWSLVPKRYPIWYPPTGFEYPYIEVQHSWVDCSGEHYGGMETETHNLFVVPSNWPLLHRYNNFIWSNASTYISKWLYTWKKCDIPTSVKNSFHHDFHQAWHETFLVEILVKNPHKKTTLFYFPHSFLRTMFANNMKISQLRTKN